MTRSAVMLLAFAAVVISMTFGLITWSAVEAAPAFRIVDVRAVDGHLVVEVQHFNADGEHWFFEHYTFQGREAFKRPRVSDRVSHHPKHRFFLESSGAVAPIRTNKEGRAEHYLPEGEQWLRHPYPHLQAASITRIINNIHQKRLGTGWTKGKYRLGTSHMDFGAADAAGATLLKERFAGLINTAYTPKSDGTYLVSSMGPTTIPRGSEWGTVSTFYPSLDGRASETTVAAWATIRAAAGDSANPGAISMNADITDNGANWTRFRRVIMLFDTQGLDDGDSIDSATLDLYEESVTNAHTSSVSMVPSTPASDSTLVLGDYAQLGTTKQATDLTLASISGTGGYFSFTLNATGLGNIDKAGITKFGMRITADNDNAEPTLQAGTSQLEVWSAEENQPGERRPALVVTHSAPSAAITGTIGDGATEQEVRDGGGTVIITLTEVTWVADDGTFAGQRQAIIDGMDAAESEANGWNAEVRDKIGVASVVRTADTVATITIAAADVGDYRVDGSEVITVTVPAAAHSASSDITATPTFTITGAGESVAVTGTLGGSGGTPAEVRAGGETIILTLTNTKWVASGATFDAERQAVLNGLDSNLAGQNGWDNRRSDFAVGDVARTSDTIVTITLSASTAYAIPQTETITAVVPASALLYGAAITGAPTFDIVPIFQLAGNRISGAIDLSAITDVAYCAIGWQATTPTNTTLTVGTSVDGGANYSAATNGECPTGITVGESLSTITDFRIKLTLGTNDNTVTPLVETLGLLVQDSAGPALYYRLNTVPGVTITDRSANSNAGTMSFPTSQTGVNATTGVLESTRSSLSLEQLLSVGDIVSPVTGAAASGNIFNQTETGFGSLPFQSMMQTLATGGELPLKFVWVVAIGLFSIALGVVALHLTGSLMISGIGMGAGLSVGAAIGAGLIPGWTVILFVILALALIVMRSRGALPL